MKQYLTDIAFTVLLLAVLGGGVYWGYSLVENATGVRAKIEENKRIIRSYGYEANKAGVPAAGNPYMRNPSDANEWLQGWMDANREGK